MGHQENGTSSPTDPMKEILRRLGPEWERMNSRRGELIEKKYGDGLSEIEEKELAQLQEEVSEALFEVCPPPPVDMTVLDRLEARVRGQSGSANSHSVQKNEELPETY